MIVSKLAKSRAQVIFQIVMLVFLLISLINYKGAASVRAYNRHEQRAPCGYLNFRSAEMQ